MRLECQSEDQYLVYVNNQYFSSLDWDDKEEISKNVKKLVLKLDQFYHLSLSGFYKMQIYLNKQIGMMIEITKLDDFGLKMKTLDLKIVIYLNTDFLVKVNDLDWIRECSEIYAFHDNYYAEIDDLSQRQILILTERGSFIYGDEVEEVKNKGTQLPTKKG